MTFITSPCEIAQNASERFADVVLVELLDPHDRSIILAREPPAAFAVVPHRSRLRLIRVQARLDNKGGASALLNQGWHCIRLALCLPLRSACTRSFGTAEIAGFAAPRPSMRWRAGRQYLAAVCRQFDKGLLFARHRWRSDSCCKLCRA